MPEQLSDRYCGPSDAPDRYLLRERRSSGGEGEVFSAVEQHANFSFRYAVKIIHADHQDDSGRWLDNLRLQAALLTQLEHSSLVKMREVFVGGPPHAAGASDAAADPRLYLVMKWIEGRSLQELLESGELPGPAAMDALVPVAEAIDYLHSGRDTDGQPVLHRDIKPANILRADDGRSYLVDFGLVRFAGAATMSKVSGTVPFMAPESLHRGEYSPASDRYSLGASLYYLLTREVPIPGDTDTMERRLGAVLGGDQSRVVRGILSMLSVSATHRPASATEWLRALRTPVADTTLGAPPAPGGPAETSFGQPTAPSAPPPGAPTSAGPYPGTAPGTPIAPGAPVSGTPTSAGAPPPGYPASPPPPFAPPPYALKPPPGMAKRRSGRKIALIVCGSLAVVLLGCCGLGIYGSSLDDEKLGSGHDPTPSTSVDHEHPPPPASKLRAVLVSPGQLVQATGVASDRIYSSSDGTKPLGGLDQFEPCADEAVSGAAIGSQTSNRFLYHDDATSGGQAYASSSVVGFYGGASTDFYRAAKQSMQRCGWQTFAMRKLGGQSVGYTRAFDEDSISADRQPNIVVLVRSGQVMFALTLTTQNGNAQSSAAQLAAAMAKHLPRTT